MLLIWQQDMEEECFGKEPIHNLIYPQLPSICLANISLIHLKTAGQKTYLLLVCSG